MRGILCSIILNLFLSLSSHKKIGIFIINTNFIYKYEKAANNNTLLLSMSFTNTVWAQSLNEDAFTLLDLNYPGLEEVNRLYHEGTRKMLQKLF